MKKWMCLLIAIALVAATATAAAEALKPLEDYFAEQLMLMEITGQAGSLETYLSMEEYVWGGNTAQSLMDLYYFYYFLLENMVANDHTGPMREMIDHFIQMAEEVAYAKGISDLNPNESAVLTYLSPWYVCLLGLTDQADDLLIAAMNRLAEYYLSYAEEVSPETDPLYDIYAGLNEMTGIAIHISAFAYSGDVEQAQATMQAYIQRHSSDEGELLDIESQIGSMGIEPMLLMLAGKPQEAAAAQVTLYDQFEAAGFFAENEAVLLLLYESDLDMVHVYEMRGIVSPPDCLAYADSLPKKIAFIVTEAPTEDVEGGFAAGDQIVAVDDIRIYAPQQMLRLRSSGDNTRFTVLRDGETVSITPPRIAGNLFGITIEQILVDSDN